MKHNIFKSLLLLVLLLTMSIAAEARIYLVSVGLSDYPGKKNDLRVSHNDAATMQWLYKENKQASTMLLMNEKATLANVKSAMRQMFSKAAADDIVVLFFSGHGVKGGFACYDGILRYEDVSNVLSSCRSQRKMVFADACFSGTFRNDNSSSSMGGSLGTNVMLFLSSRNNETSIETPRMTNGFFTHALQHGLRGGADYNHDRVITAKELFKYVSAKVKSDSNDRQHPVMWGKFPDNMPVMKW